MTDKQKEQVVISTAKALGYRLSPINDIHGQGGIAAWYNPLGYPIAVNIDSALEILQTDMFRRYGIKPLLP